jgi:hypothetical protein
MDVRGGRTRGLVPLLVMAAVFGIAPWAGAASRPVVPPTAIPWVAQYSLDVVSGAQHGSWNEHHASLGGCDAPETGSGSQSVTLSPHGSVPVFANGVGPTLTSIVIVGEPERTNPNPSPTNPFQLLEPTVKSTAAIDRSGSVQDGAPPDPTLCPSGDGGGTPPVPDCGARQATLTLWFRQHSNVLHFEQPDDSIPGNPYQDCPYLGSGVFPDWLPLDVFMPLSGWGPPPPVGTGHGPGIPVQLDGHTSDSHHDQDLDWTASEQLTLRFVPVTVTPTIVLGDVSNEAVSPAGGVGIPVTCPKRETPHCSGSVELALDINDPHTFPAPAAGTLKVASANFNVPAGKRQRVSIVLHHRTKAQLRALAQAPMVLVVTVGRRGHVSYEASTVKLHV